MRDACQSHERACTGRMTDAHPNAIQGTRSPAAGPVLCERAFAILWRLLTVCLGHHGSTWDRHGSGLRTKSDPAVIQQVEADIGASPLQLPLPLMLGERPLHAPFRYTVPARYEPLGYVPHKLHAP